MTRLRPDARAGCLCLRPAAVDAVCCVRAQCAGLQSRAAPSPHRLLHALISVLVLLLCLPSSSTATRVPIRINSGPSLSYPSPSQSQNAAHSAGRSPRRSASGVHLTHSQSGVALSRPPAAFALPPTLLDRWHVSEGGQELEEGAAAGGRDDSAYEAALWRRWDGDCLTASIDGYSYSLCPVPQRHAAQPDHQPACLPGVSDTRCTASDSDRQCGARCCELPGLILRPAVACCVAAGCVSACGTAGR